MFEHLDDPTPGRTGTGPQLAAVRNRAREITRDRRRGQLAVGSVTLTAAASVSGIAVLTGAGPLRHLNGQAAGGGAGAHPAAATKPGVPKGGVERPGQTAGVPGSKAVGPMKSPAPGASATNPNGGGCDYYPMAAAQTPPQGYVVNAEPASKQPTLPFRRADGGNATVDLKITCAGIPPEDRTSSEKRTVTAIKVAGFDGYLWHAADEAGVEWTASDHTSVYIKATGADGVRLSDAALEAYAATLPAT